MKQTRELYPIDGFNHEKQTWIAENRCLLPTKHDKHYEIPKMEIKMIPHELGRVLNKGEMIRKGDLHKNNRTGKWQEVPNCYRCCSAIYEMIVRKVEDNG